MMDDEYYYDRDFKLNSKKFNDFYQEDGQEDFLMLLGKSIRDNISNKIQIGGVSWEGDWHLSIRTATFNEVAKLDEFIQYVEQNKILDSLIEHYIKFYRRSSVERFDELFCEFKSFQAIKKNYQELNKELPQHGIIKRSKL